MTDNSGARPRRHALLSGTPQAWHGVLAGGLAVLTAATVTLLTRTADPASAATTVASVRNAVIRLADGTERTAAVGDRLPRGAQLRTGTDGGAQLSTAGREVYVGALSTVDVRDGVSQSLERGQVMVDARRGPRLSLATRAGDVTAASGALVRVETLAVFLRTGVFDGAADVTPLGRRLTTPVPALHQVQVPYAGTPGPVTALALRDDRWEARLAADLVGADQDLTRLADSLGGASGAALVTAAPAALRTTPAAPGAARGEQALAVALAQAATVGSDPADTLATISSARGYGGSWGVIAALVGARVTAVSALLDGALGPMTDGSGGSTTVAGRLPSLQELLQPQAGPTVPAGSGGTPAPTPTPTPSRPSGGSGGGSGGGGGGGTPPPGLVTGLVDTVLGLLPTLSPSPSPAATTTKTTAPLVPTVPLPSPTSSPLLGVTLHLG
ncbi:MAG: hypothetical protein ACXVFV_01810 [Mycobacteriales bacterium]